ncbi:MAG: hypothetical protein IPQ07_31630 [Myxococcales bacterium]|nr:hypothetical protein [Myxococcales bacterium]
MRLLAILGVSLLCGSAAADPTPAYQIFEDSALGMTLPPRKILGTDKGLDAVVTDCIMHAPAASGSALYWLEIGKAGNVTVAKVRGTGSSALDSCIAGGLKKASVTEKLPAAIVVVGRVDVLDRNKNLGTFNPSPKVSDVAVLLDAKSGPWQLGTKRLAYTENRAADISQALDAQSGAINACAAKRDKTLAAVDLIAWHDGKAIVRGTGDSAYDTCLARALELIKLPNASSAIWMELSLRKAAEPLAPRTDKASMSKEQGLKDALTTAVRSRKAALLDCTDGKPKAKLAKLTVVLAGGKANVKSVATGDAAADACVKTKFVDVTIKAAEAADKLEYDVELE